MNTLNICWHWETVAIPITIWELIYIIFNKSNGVERFDSFVYFLYRLQANSYRVFHFCGIIYAYRIKYRTYHTPLVDAKLLLGLFTSYSNICPGNSSSFELVLRPDSICIHVMKALTPSCPQFRDLYQYHVGRSRQFIMSFLFTVPIFTAYWSKTVRFIIVWGTFAFPVNSSPPGQNGRHFADDVFRCIFLNEKFCILNFTEVYS